MPDDIFEPHAFMYLRLTSKTAIIRRMTEALIEESALPADNRPPRAEIEGIVGALIERESLGPTGVGEGAAIPHARHPAVPTFTGAVAFLKDAIPWNSPDNVPVSTIILYLAPFGGSPSIYLGHMAAAMRAVRDPEVIKRWRYLMG